MNALERLEATLSDDGHAFAPVRVGGAVAGVTGDGIKVLGLANRARIDDLLEIAGPDGETLAQIVRIAPDGVFAKPVDRGRPPRLGSIAWHRPPIAVAPSPAWTGRIVDALGRPIDGRGPLPTGPEPRPILAAAPDALSRPKPTIPLATGIRAIDLFTPLVHGQRIGVFAGAGVGKTTLLSMMASVAAFDVAVIALTGERGREVRGLIEGPLAHCRDRSITVVATADESAMRRRAAPLTAMTIAESLRDAGARVLVVIDSITRMAHAMREIALAAGELPVARGYPPSVLSALPAFLERAGGAASGTITALVSVLVDGDDPNEPVADTARGSLDGHLVLDRAIADSGRYPAIDLLGSLSRLAESVWTPDQRALVLRLRAIIARYEDTRDLRLVAGRDMAADPELQQAVALVPRIYDALRQGPDDPPAADVYAELAAILRQQTARNP